jgi:hypothetical protein
MTTSYHDIIQDHWESILKLYLQFEAQKPVMLFDIREGEIHALPYEGFKTQLNAKSQVALTEQYARALENNLMVLFVRDTENNNIASYSLEITE